MDKRKLPFSKEHKIKIGLGNKGKVRSEEQKLKISQTKISQNLTEEKNPNWKGDLAKYTAMHMWVVSRKGKPKKCDHCLREDLDIRQYHWANIDHLYKRNLDDYIRLCASCHQKYDIENNQYCGGKRKATN